MSHLRTAGRHLLSLIGTAQSRSDLRSREEEHIVDPVDTSLSDQAAGEFQQGQAQRDISHLVNVEVMILVDDEVIAGLCIQPFEVRAPRWLIGEPSAGPRQ
jgi:hypothetical protein